MATVAWTLVSFVGEAKMYTASLGDADITEPLKMNEGQNEVTVLLRGTVGGATVKVLGSLASENFVQLDDAYGTAMSYTALGVCKPVGPSVREIEVQSSGGSGTTVVAEVKIEPKVRP